MKNTISGKSFLIVDDNTEELRRLANFVSSLGGKWFGASSFASAVGILDQEQIECLITDIHFDQELLDGRVPGGIQLLKYAKDNHPNVVLIATSGDPRLETYHASVKAGALANITKPVKNTDALQIAISEAMIRKYETRLDSPMDLPKFLKEIYERYPDGLVIPTESRKLLRGLAKHTSSTLVLSGETGTGKEQMAQYLFSCRREIDGAIPFVPVNCAAIDLSLATSLLFGHKKGAFSGAGETTNGYIGDANGGILFLDEIHCLDLQCQQKLLRVLNDGTYERLGDTKTLRSEFQLVTASTKDLKLEVEAGRFLVDLYMRLMGGVELNLLPLRERLHEIPAFVGIFLVKNKLDLSEAEFRKLCLNLQAYQWQGNVRQLFKLLQSWHVTAQCMDVRPSVDFLPNFPGMGIQNSIASTGSHFDHLEPSDRKSVELFIQALQANQSLDESMDALEKAILKKALQRNASIGETAAGLGLARSTLDSKRRKHGLD